MPGAPAGDGVACRMAWQVLAAELGCECGESTDLRSLLFLEFGGCHDGGFVVFESS